MRKTYETFGKNSKNPTADDLSLLLATLTIFKENFLKNPTIEADGKAIQNYILSRRGLTFSDPLTLPEYINFCWFKDKNEEEKKKCKSNIHQIYNAILNRLKIRFIDGGGKRKKKKKKFTRKYKKSNKKKKKNKRKTRKKKPYRKR